MSYTRAIVTTDSFRDYHLRLQFKWGEKKWAPRANAVRDSGLLYHVYLDPGTSGRTWPPSVELQIQEHDCGDLWAIQSQITVRHRETTDAEGRPLRIFDPAGAPFVFSQEPTTNSRCVKAADFENPTGEWNTIELICLGDESIHIVNGRVVMRLRDFKQRISETAWAPLREGRIALQSEGAEIYYRNIAIRSITAVPAEYVERRP